MATQTRAPTGDGTVTGTVSGSAGSRFTLVDDYPDAGTGDMLTFGTAASTINFTFSAFTVPAGSTGLSVQVRYVDGEAANGSNNCGGRLVINGSNFNAATHNPSGTAGTAREDNFATNPSSGAAWTVDEVNGIGTHGIDGFGINSTDSNPTFNVRSIEIQVTYTPIVELTLSKTLDNATSSGTVVVTTEATLSKTLDAATSSGTVVVSTLATLAKTLEEATSSGTITVETTGSSLTLSQTLEEATGQGSITVSTLATLAVTLADATSVGTIEVTSELLASLEVTLEDASSVGTVYVASAAKPRDPQKPDILRACYSSRGGRYR